MLKSPIGLSTKLAHFVVSKVICKNCCDPSSVGLLAITSWFVCELSSAFKQQSSAIILTWDVRKLWRWGTLLEYQSNMTNRDKVQHLFTYLTTWPAWDCIVILPDSAVSNVAFYQAHQALLDATGQEDKASKEASSSEDTSSMPSLLPDTGWGGWPQIVAAENDHEPKLQPFPENAQEGMQHSSKKRGQRLQPM